MTQESAIYTFLLCVCVWVGVLLSDCFYETSKKVWWFLVPILHENISWAWNDLIFLEKLCKARSDFLPHKWNCILFYQLLKSWDNSVSITTGYGLDDLMIRVWFPKGIGNFSLWHCVQTGSGAHPASCPVDTGALSMRVKQPGHEADHSPPSNAKIKECLELYLHSTPIHFHDMVLG
jgi:hypothetical protein